MGFGSAGRRAFTVNGPAVNQAARLEALGSRLGLRPALSEEFAAHCGCPVIHRGSHDAKGMAVPLPVFERA